MAICSTHNQAIPRAFRKSEVFELTGFDAICLILFHTGQKPIGVVCRIADHGRFCQSMQKSGSGYGDGNHHSSDQGPEISQQARPRHCPTTGNIAWNRRYMQDANVEFRQNSKYRVAGRFGWKIRYDARQTLSAAVCRGPGDWRAAIM